MPILNHYSVPITIINQAFQKSITLLFIPFPTDLIDPINLIEAIERNMNMLKRNEHTLPSIGDDAGSDGRGDAISNSMSMMVSKLGGRRKITRVLAVLAVIHCLLTISKNQSSNLRRATSSTGSAFRANEKTLPLELMQAIQQASRAGSISTPATELTSDSTRSMSGAALLGSVSAAPGAIPHETDPALVAQLKSLSPGDPRDLEEEAERGLFPVLLGSKKKKIDVPLSMSEAGVEEGNGAQPVDPSLLLHNLDPGAIQNMDAETLQKVMEANNINPKVLPQVSTSSLAAQQPSQEAPSMGASNEAGFLGPPPVGEFHDEIGTTILDGPLPRSGDPPSTPDLTTLLNQYSESDISAILESLGKNGASLESSKPVMDTKNLPPPQCTKPPRMKGPRQKEVKPTMNASYPGSGARLSWKLIRAVTGLMTSDDAVDTDDLSKKGVVVSIKSHYPAHGSSEALFKPFSKVDRSVLLIRNPVKAMPSFLSYLYEQENGLVNHSTRVPVEHWIEWRDAHFNKELQSWVHHTLFWMEHNAPENTLIMFYESLVNPETGPAELLRLGQFLETSSGEKMAQEVEDIPCVWDYVVNSRGDTSMMGKTPQSLRKGAKVFPYTDEQIDTLVHYLGSLGQIYPEELGPMMDRYVVETLALKSSN